MIVLASSSDGLSCVRDAETLLYTYGVLRIMYDMTMIVYVPVRRITLEPENAERSAMDTTVPGRMNGAMTERSRSAAPLGFFLSVM